MPPPEVVLLVRIAAGGIAITAGLSSASLVKSALEEWSPNLVYTPPLSERLWWTALKLTGALVAGATSVLLAFLVIHN